MAVNGTIVSNDDNSFIKSILIIGIVFSILYFIINWVVESFKSLCPSGTHKDELDPTQCIEICRPDSHFDRISMSCIDCPEGQFKDSTGKCVDCPIGQFKDSKGRCISCPPNWKLCGAPESSNCMDTSTDICLDDRPCRKDLVEKDSSSGKEVCGKPCPPDRVFGDNECCAENQKSIDGATCCDIKNVHIFKNKAVCCDPANFSEIDGCCPSTQTLSSGRCMIKCVNDLKNNEVTYCDPEKQRCNQGICFSRGCEFSKPLDYGIKQINVGGLESTPIEGCKPVDTDKVIFDPEVGPWRTCENTTNTWSITTQRTSDLPCTQTDCNSLNNIQGVQVTTYPENATKESKCEATFLCGAKGSVMGEACDLCPVPEGGDTSQCCFTSEGKYTGLSCSFENSCVSTPGGFRCVDADLKKKCDAFVGVDREKNCYYNAPVIPCTYGGETPTMDAKCDCDNIPAKDCKNTVDQTNCYITGNNPITMARSGTKCEGAPRYRDGTVVFNHHQRDYNNFGEVYIDDVNFPSLQYNPFPNEKCISGTHTKYGPHNYDQGSEGPHRSTWCIACGGGGGQNGDDSTTMNVCGTFGQ